MLNAREVVLLDVPTLEQQLLGLVWKGGKIDHPSGEHDDYAKAVAGVVHKVAASRWDGALPVGIRERRSPWRTPGDWRR